jgi:ABC-type nickel/cobalt efflux system permease component RcnA
MEFSLLIILYYGILHALGPDHLSAIALFSIGKNKRDTLLLSLLFALGHGCMLYLLALCVEQIASEHILQYGDIISSAVILMMGIYLVYLAITDKIRIDKHKHTSHAHTHIYYQDAHLHDKSMLLSLGLLMGVGGIRGMLVTLSVISHQSVGIEMVFAFIAGVSIVFLLFGYLIYLINESFIRSAHALRYGILSGGLLSIGIGTYNLDVPYVL